MQNPKWNPPPTPLFILFYFYKDICVFQSFSLLVSIWNNPWWECEVGSAHKLWVCSVPAVTQHHSVHSLELMSEKPRFIMAYTDHTWLSQQTLGAATALVGWACVSSSPVCTCIHCYMSCSLCTQASFPFCCPPLVPMFCFLWFIAITLWWDGWLWAVI